MIQNGKIIMKIYKKKKSHAYNSFATFRLKNVKVRINWRLEAAHKIIMEISLLILEKSWNFDFECLWEPCPPAAGEMSSVFTFALSPQ